MAVCEIHLGNNNALQKMTSFMAILPEGKSGPFPVFTLLHGLSDDHTAWTRRTSVERYVQDLPLIVVMPNGERGFYTDAIDNPLAAFETVVTRDLINFVDSTFQTIPTREGRVVAGLSMGGYGALKLALKNPHLFRAAVSHSGAVSFGSIPFDAPQVPAWLQEFVPIFGRNPRGGSEDIFALAKSYTDGTRERALLPALRVDCGVDDFLIQDNRNLHAHLEELGIAHEYLEHAGDHNWEYWDAHIKETIAFFARELGIE